MSGTLCRKPVVDRIDHSGVLRSVRNGAAVGDVGVSNLQGAIVRPQHAKARHVVTVNVLRAAELTARKALSLLCEMAPDERDLSAVSIVGGHALLAARSSVSEGVGAAFKIERHDLGARRGDLAQTRIVRAGRRVPGDTSAEEQNGKLCDNFYYQDSRSQRLAARTDALR
jgi:hypothetical protein